MKVEWIKDRIGIEELYMVRFCYNSWQVKVWSPVHGRYKFTRHLKYFLARAIYDAILRKRSG